MAEFEHNTANNRTRYRKLVNGAVHIDERYTFDIAQRQHTVTQGGALQVTYAYDANSRPTSKTLANGVTTDYTYNLSGLVTRMVNRRGNVILSQFDHVYYLDGNTHRVTEQTFVTTPPAITDTSLSVGWLGAAYSHTLTGTGDTPLTWGIASGSLPTGLSLNAATGVITGTPTALGTFAFTIMVSNAHGSASRAFRMTINSPHPEIRTTGISDRLVNKETYEELVAWGAGPIVWSVESGQLPPGTDIDARTGMFHGRPTVTGTFTFTVAATNAFGSATRTITLSILPSPDPPLITTDFLPDGMVGEYYWYQLNASGPSYLDIPGDYPFEWYSTELPPGLHLNQRSGELSGTPAQAGTFWVNITAANMYGGYSQRFNMTIMPRFHQAASFDAASFDAAMETSAGIAPMSAAALSTRTITYTYDTARRLVREHDTGVGGAATTRAYAFDARGNRTQMTVTGAQVYTVTYTYDLNNRLLTEIRTGNSPSTATFTYDRNGNQLTRVSGGQTETRVYDAFNQLTSFNVPGTASSYAYRADGLRHSKTVGGVRTTHVWNRGQIVLEQNASGAVINRFIRDARGQLLRSDHHGWYLYNARGDVVQRVDNSGNVLQTYRYTAFGVEISPNPTDTNRFRFAGMYWDAHRSEYMTRHRMFNPRIGRWTQPDPFWNRHNMMGSVSARTQAGNLFMFVMHNPVRWVDPTGLFALHPVWSQREYIAWAPRETSSWDTSWRNPNAASPASAPISAPISMGGLHFGSGPLATMPSVTMGSVSFLRPHTVGIGKKPDNPMDAKILEGGGGTFKGRIGGSSAGGTSGVNAPAAKNITPANPKRVDVRFLEKYDIDAHAFKREVLGKRAPVAHYDIFVDRNGDIWLQRKGTSTWIPTGESID